jgi:hypothetical protein
MLEQERLRAQQLEDNFMKEKNNVKCLQSLLEAERQRSRAVKLEDSEFIEVRFMCSQGT